MDLTSATGEARDLLDAVSAPPFEFRQLSWAPRQRDREFWASRYREDAVSVSAGGPLLRGRDAIAAHLEERHGSQEVALMTDILNLEVVSGVGFIWGIFRVARLPTAQRPGLERRGVFQAVLRRDGDDGWKIWREIDSHSFDADRLYGTIPPGPRWIS